jgi:hypothetical protein
VTRGRLAAAVAAAALLLAGLLMWHRWGALVWLDAAIAYCF